MKFKVGDEVRVREDLISGVDYGSFPFVNSMKEYRGEVVTIHEVNPRATAYEIAEDGGEAYWTDEMLEPITDHDYLMDKILERNNKPEKLNTGDPWIDNLPESYFEMYEEETLKELTEPLDLIEQHKRICERLNKVYADKNHDYGNSFGETYQKLGAISAVTRISDKTSRLQSLVTKDEQRVDDERLIDTALDLANYAIMFAMELEETE